jgi:hypothetical protein|tara:strand:+ start:6475 stop:7089 length:615 start_codon:yes stop_codon:yes gene_type:complete
MPELTEDEKAALTVVTGDHTNPARISYAKIFEPVKNDLSGKAEYSAMFLIPKSDTETVDKIKTAIKTAIHGKWGDKKPSGIRIPLRDGDKDGDTGVPASAVAGAEPYGGHYFINAKNTRPPGIVDQKRNEILDSGQVVSGDYVRASLNAFAYDNKSKGVSFGLNGVQLVRKGEPLGSGFVASSSFGDIPMAVDVAGSSSDDMFT